MRQVPGRRRRHGAFELWEWRRDSVYYAKDWEQPWPGGGGLVWVASSAVIASTSGGNRCGAAGTPGSAGTTERGRASLEVGTEDRRLSRLDVHNQELSFESLLLFKHKLVSFGKY